MSHLTRRAFLVVTTVAHMAALPLAIEAISTIALEHPEWMDEERTWEEWEKVYGKVR